jgi:hypothetical protein
MMIRPPTVLLVTRAKGSRTVVRATGAGHPAGTVGCSP